MSFKDKAVSFFGWVAGLGNGKLAGYRTYISIAISFILKALVTWNVVGAGNADAQHISQPTDAFLLLGSGFADLCAVFFRAAASGPGPLAGQAEISRALRLNSTIK